MLTFTTMNVVGFCSIENLHIPLNPSCTILIKAPNGKGKSTILSALVWAIYGKNLKGVSEVTTWEKVRPKDYQGVMVEVFFQKGEHIYKIIRCQKCNIVLEDGAKGKDRLILMKDNEVVNVKGKNKLQDAINAELGLSYTLFMNSIMFGQGIKRLIQESNSDKKKIFEEVFDLEFLNIAKGIAMQDKNNLLAQANEVEHQSALLKKELEANKEAYFDLRDREKGFKEKIKSERRELKKDREDLTKQLIKKQQQLKDEVEQSLRIKIKKHTDYVDGLKSKIKHNRNISGVSLPDFVKKLKIQLDKGHYKRAKESVDIIYKAIINSDKLQEEYEDALGRLDELRTTNEKYKRLQKNAMILLLILLILTRSWKSSNKRNLRLCLLNIKRNLKRLEKLFVR